MFDFRISGQPLATFGKHLVGQRLNVFGIEPEHRVRPAPPPTPSAPDSRPPCSAPARPSCQAPARRALLLAFRRRRSIPPPPSPVIPRGWFLSSRHKLSAAIRWPAGFAMLRTKRTLCAVAHKRNLRGRHHRILHASFCGSGAPFAEHQVICDAVHPLGDETPTKDYGTLTNGNRSRIVLVIRPTPHSSPMSSIATMASGSLKSTRGSAPRSFNASINARSSSCSSA